jgi:long-subunit fatty acid transport protein
MNRNALKTLLASTLVIASAASWAAGFPAAYGEFSSVDMANTASAAAPAQAHPTRKAAEGHTRAEAQAEFEAARCRGDLPYDGETGRTYRDVFPGSYPKANCR